MTGSQRPQASVWQAYNLWFLERWGTGNIIITRLANGSVSFSGVSRCWGYVAAAPVPAVLDKPGTIRVRADIAISRGKVCVAIITPDRKSFYKQAIVEGIGPHRVEMEADCSN